MFSVQFALLYVICILVLSMNQIFCEEFSILKPEYSHLQSCPTDVTQCRWNSSQAVPNCDNPQKYYCALCYFCPRTNGESCGGAYHRKGHCAKNLFCIKNSTKLSDRELINGIIDIEGICKPRSCFKDCSAQSIKWICGSDGKWRANSCFFNRDKRCDPSTPDTKIRRVKNNPHDYCGELPTLLPSVTDSLPTRTTSGSKQQIESTAVVTTTQKPPQPTSLPSNSHRST